MNSENKYCFRRYNGQLTTPLYKYYGNIDYAKDAIINKRIHLESPSTYNDIYDSTFFVSEDNLISIHNTSDNICNLMKQLVDKEYHNALSACQTTNFDEHFSFCQAIDFICEYDTALSKEALKTQLIDSIKQNGVIQALNNKVSCFSEKNDSLLMWAYYANSANGLCLGFDINNDVLLRENCHKVQYSDKFSYEPKGFDMYFRKSEVWSHEQEWRIVCDCKDDYIYTNSIRSMILGYKLPQKNYEELLRIGIEQGLKVYKARPSTEKYKLIIEPVLTSAYKEKPNEIQL